MIDKLAARFPGRKDASVTNILASHEEQKRIEWHTAKGLILYLASVRESKVTSEQIVFLKNNWFREIRYYLDKGLLFEADKSLADLQKNVSKFGGDWRLTLQEEEVVNTYLRILGKDEGSKHARK